MQVLLSTKSSCSSPSLIRQLQSTCLNSSHQSSHRMTRRWGKLWPPHLLGLLVFEDCALAGPSSEPPPLLLLLLSRWIDLGQLHREQGSPKRSAGSAITFPQTANGMHGQEQLPLCPTETLPGGLREHHIHDHVPATLFPTCESSGTSSRLNRSFGIPYLMRRGAGIL